MRDDFFEDLLELFLVDVAEGLLEVLAGVFLLVAGLEWELFDAGVLLAGFFEVGLLAAVLLEAVLLDVVLCGALFVFELAESDLA